VVPAAVVALVARNLVSVVLDTMILNVVALVVPLVFLVRLSSDRALLGSFANSRRRTAVLWCLTAGLLGLGLTVVVGLLGRVL
jgi:Mn2+/Fe2+ NRAMP family transporter